MKKRTWLYVCALEAGAFMLAVALRADAAPEPSYAAEVRRTSFGIPHVLAQDERGLGFGAGYAYAQDNLCLLGQMIVTVNAERARFFGAEAADGPDIESGGPPVPNLQSDFFFKLLNSPEEVARVWKNQSKESVDLIEGYVAGFNHFLAKQPKAQRPAACRDAAWLRPLERNDLIRLMRRLAVEASSIQFMRGLLAAQPPGSAKQARMMSPSGEPPRNADVRRMSASAGASESHSDWRRWSERRAQVGSNAVALGKLATENGRGLLLGNPHYPWYGALRFYQLHLTIPGKLDVMGTTLGGFPVVTIGFNQHVAWSHTVNTSSHFTLYALTLDPADPTRYVVDGVSKSMVKRTVTVDADGKGGKRSHDFWVSEYGPVLVLPGELDWSAKTAYALRDANADNSRMIDAWYAMGRARSLDEMEHAIRSTVGIPWVNTIATDALGGTLYTDVTVVPNLPKSKQEACVAEPFRKLAAQGLFVLTAGKACDWNVDPAAPQPGIFAGRDLPVLRRDDYVQNSNDSAWMTNPAQPLAGFAPIVSEQDVAQGGRTRIGISQIQARLAGTDGLPGNRFNPANLAQIAFGNRSYYGTLLREDLLKVCDGAKSATLDGASVDLVPACALFAKWDGHANLDSVGYPLAREWIDDFTQQAGIWAVPFSGSDPVSTPRGLKTHDAKVVEALRESLARAVLSLRKSGIDASKPLRELQIVEHNGRRTPIPGGSSGDIYNAIHAEASDGVERVRSGSSYVQIVSFEKDGPQARAVLTYSQSTDPASPHFGDQAPLFSRGEWNALPYTEAQIRADTEYRSEKIAN